jgi:hypothetical protein
MYQASGPLFPKRKRQHVEQEQSCESWADTKLTGCVFILKVDTSHLVKTLKAMELDSLKF